MKKWNDSLKARYPDATPVTIKSPIPEITTTTTVTTPTSG